MDRTTTVATAATNVPLGMTNLGNTCFFNASVQFLCHILVTCDRNHTRPKNTRYVQLWEELCQVCRVQGAAVRDDRFLCGGVTITPTSLLTAFRQTALSSALRQPGRQQDAHETLVHLLECVPGNVSARWRVDTTTRVRDTAGNISSTDWSTSHLMTTLSGASPTAPPPRLSDLVRDVFAMEKLQNGSIKDTSVRSVGDWLVVLIGRSSSRSTGRVNGPVVLDSSLTIPTTDVRGVRRKVRFRLAAVVHHLGVHARCGHYVTDILAHDSHARGRWIRCDDSRVMHLKEGMGPGIPPEKESTTAYICAYSKCAIPLRG